MNLSLDPELVRLVWHWHARPDVAVALVLVGVVYLRGWRRFRRQGHRQLASGWRLAAYLAGLTSLTLALLSPLDHLAEVRFSAHMVQHQLLLMVAPPLLLFGNPFPFGLWGLPVRVRRRIAGTLTQAGPVRAAWRLLTWMPVAGGAYTLCLWAWHTPIFYEAALRSRLVHDLEHVTFFGTAILFWWPIINPAPRLHRLTTKAQYGFRIAYVIMATGLNTFLGFVIGTAERILYPSYQAMHISVDSAVGDQAFGGGIMWSASHMFLIAILVLLSHAMDAEERHAQPRARVPAPSDSSGAAR